MKHTLTPCPLSHPVGEGELAKSPLMLGGRGDLGVRGNTPKKDMGNA